MIYTQIYHCKQNSFQFCPQSISHSLRKTKEDVSWMTSLGLKPLYIVIPLAQSRETLFATKEDKSPCSQRNNLLSVISAGLPFQAPPYSQQPALHWILAGGVNSFYPRSFPSGNYVRKSLCRRRWSCSRHKNSNTAMHFQESPGRYLTSYPN